jgi:hypothetical protein
MRDLFYHVAVGVGIGAIVLHVIGLVIFLIS